MYTPIPVLVFFLLISPAALSQEKEGQDPGPKMSSVSVEIGKSAMVGNVVFDRNFANRKNGMRAFAGFNIAKYRPVFTVGAGLYHLFGSKQNRLEIGSDIGYINVGKVIDSANNRKSFKPDFETSSFIMSVNAGYRFEAPKYLLRLGLSPTLVKDEFFLGGYFSLGIRF